MFSLKNRLSLHFSLLNLLDIFNLSNRFRKVSLWKRLIGSLIFLVSVPMIITSLYYYIESSRAISGKISTYSSYSINELSRNIRTALDQIENYSIELETSDLIQQTIEDYSTFTNWGRMNAERMIHDLITRKPFFNNYITCINVYPYKSGVLHAYNSQTISLTDNLQNNFFEEISMKRGIPIWAPLDSKNESIDYTRVDINNKYNHNSGVVMGRIFYSINRGGPAGYFLIRINEKYLYNIYKDIDMGPHTKIFIINSNGVVVSSKDLDLIKPTQLYENRNLINEILYIEGREVKKDWNAIYKPHNFIMKKEQQMIAFSHIIGTDWYIVADIPFSYLNIESRRVGTYTLVLETAFILIAVFLSVIISKSIYEPIKKLIVMMDKVEKGNLDVYIPDNNNDELGKVTNNFNDMVSEVKKLLENVKTKERQKTVAEFKALQSQINPHFLSNTLNTIKWLADIQKAENISTLTNALINLLQISIGRQESDFITLMKEIEHVKYYIYIQKHRYYNKFNIKYDFEDEILECKVIRFILQPIVENAIIHGISPMEGQGLISIKGYRDSDNLKIIVTDNGIGIPEQKLASLTEQLCSLQKNEDVGGLNQSGGEGSAQLGYHSIGLENVNKRIKLYFGEEYGINIRSTRGLFTSVEITLPCIKGGESSFE